MDFSDHWNLGSQGDYAMKEHPLMFNDNSDDYVDFSGLQDPSYGEGNSHLYALSPPPNFNAFANLSPIFLDNPPQASTSDDAFSLNLAEYDKEVSNIGFEESQGDSSAHGMQRYDSDGIRRAAVACGPCHKAKTSCGHERPCRRCCRLGIEALCVDRPHKRRGRPIKPKDTKVQRTGNASGLKLSTVSAVDPSAMSVVWAKNWRSSVEETCSDIRDFPVLVDKISKLFESEKASVDPIFIRKIRSSLLFPGEKLDIINDSAELMKAANVDVMEQWPVGIVKVSFHSESENILVYANKQILSLTGAEKVSDIIPGLWTSFVNPSDWKEVISLAMEALREDDSPSTVRLIRVLSHDGSSSRCALRVKYNFTDEKRSQIQSISFIFMPISDPNLSF